jgi:membrane protein DedA with SNARE-associated domain
LQGLFTDYLETYGYIFLFVGTFLEGEAVLILAGYFAFQTKLNIFGVILTAFAGSFLGDQFYFYIGRWRGRWLINLFPAMAGKFRRGLKLIEKYGAFVAFVSRFTYGFRILLPVILGMTRLSRIKFLYLNLGSAFAWALIFSAAGFLFGKSASFFIEDLDKYEPYVILVLCSIIGCMWLAHFIHFWWLARPARLRLKRMRKRRIDKTSQIESDGSD